MEAELSSKQIQRQIIGNACQFEVSFCKLHLDIVPLPSGKQPHNHGKSPFLMGKSTISMAIFNKRLNYQKVIQVI